MTPDKYIGRTSQALSSARLLLADGDIDGACNRAYYAMFDAAHAALLRYSAQINPAETRTHRGLISTFGRYMVKAGYVSPELGRTLNEVEHIRRLADYTGEDISYEKANWAIEQATAFVAVMRAKCGPEPSGKE